MKRKDGKEVTVLDSVHVVHDEHANPVCYEGTLTGITERKLAKEGMLASEAKYRELVENVDEIIYAGQFGANRMVSPITFMSDQVERILGYRAKEFLDDPRVWSRNLHPDDRAEVQAATQLVIEGKRAVRVYRMRKRNSGEYCWLEDHLVPQVDSTGRVTGCLGVARDITERKQMEEELKNYSENLEAEVEERTTELRLTKERLDCLIRSNPAVIYSGTPLADLSDWHVTFLSDRVTQMLGYRPEQFIDHPDFRRTRVHPEDLDAIMEATKSIWKEGHCVSEFRFLHRDGEYRWIREEINVVRDKDGKPIEVNGFWTDISEKKRVEQENEELNVELAMRLSDVTDRLESLARAREKLKVSPDVATGLDVILETVLRDFDLDFGAVLILDRQTNRMNVRASKGKVKEISLNESYPVQGFVELKDLQAKSITRVVGEGERSILGTAIVHAIPILARNEIYGLLTFGNQEQNSLRQSSIRILESYAELVHSFMIERSMAVTPILESRIEQHVTNLEPGEMYIAKKNPAKAFDVFASMVFGGHEGLCITRMHPAKVRSKYGLQKTPIVWLTNEASEGEKSVHAIQDLSIMIADYLEKAEKAIVLIDGFEYIITNHGFEIFLKFLQILKDRLQRRNAVLIAPVLEQALAPKELALVEREMQALTEQ